MIRRLFVAVVLGFLVLVTMGCSPIRHQEARERPPSPPDETTVMRHLVVSAPTAGTDHVYGNVSGWYLVSAPSGVGAGAYNAQTVWRWNSALREYEEFPYIEPSRGYWALLPAGHRVFIGRGSPREIYEPLGAGWNMVSVSSMVPRAELRFKAAGVVKNHAEAVAAGWIRPMVWGFQASEGNQYHRVETLSPWYGYFIYSYRNLVFLGGGAPPGPVGRISALEVRRLAAVGIDVGVLNISTLEFFDIYTKEVVGRLVAEYRRSNPPPAWPEASTYYEEQFALWVRQRYSHAAIGSAVLWPPQAAVSRGYTPGQSRPWVYVILSGPQGLERWLLCIRRELAFRWSEILGGSWVKM